MLQCITKEHEITWFRHHSVIYILIIEKFGGEGFEVINFAISFVLINVISI